jgi:hypothetical protein
MSPLDVTENLKGISSATKIAEEIRTRILRFAVDRTSGTRSRPLSEGSRFGRRHWLLEYGSGSMGTEGSNPSLSGDESLSAVTVRDRSVA